jgi:hypothetical protein
MLECEHEEITDEGICKTCGVDITSQAFLDSLPEPPPDSQLGDIMGIIRVATTTAEEFLVHLEDCRNPLCPNQPKLRWMGTQLVRPSRGEVWSEVVKPAYTLAQELGYRGAFERWNEICLEYVRLLIAEKMS